MRGWIVLFFLFWIQNLWSESFSYEELVIPQRVEKLFPSEKELRDYAKTNTTAVGDYAVGVFYLYHAYGLVNVLKVSEKDMRRCTKEAIAFLERAQKRAPDEPMIFSMLGGAYLFSCQWGGVMDRMRNGRKGVFYMDKAVVMKPTLLILRENRMRSYINLPPEYFPNILKSIPEDADLLLANLDKGKITEQGYVQELRSLCYYAKGLVAYYQKEKQKAHDFLKKVEPGTTIAQKAHLLLKKVEE